MASFEMNLVIPSTYPRPIMRKTEITILIISNNEFINIEQLQRMYCRIALSVKFWFSAFEEKPIIPKMNKVQASF